MKKDLTWQRFGALTAITFYWFIKWKSRRTYRCDCWNIVHTRWSNVTFWHKNSCWCLNHKFTKHNMTWTHFYSKWTSLKQRCNNKNNKCYKDYGWRWVENKWSTFEEFKNDMYQSYLEHIGKHWEKQTTIDRIDVNGHYCKDNCKWATRQEQCSNKRNSIICKYNGEIHTIEERYRIILSHKI